MAEPSACLVSEVSRAARVVWGASGETSCRSWGKMLRFETTILVFGLFIPSQRRSFLREGVSRDKQWETKRWGGNNETDMVVGTEMEVIWEKRKLEKNNKNEWGIFLFSI